MAACSSLNIPQKLDSFLYNAELKSGDYDADGWRKSMLQYEELGKTLERIFNSEELENSLEGLSKKLKEIFGGMDKEK